MFGISSNLIWFSFNDFCPDIDFGLAMAIEKLDDNCPKQKRYIAIEDLKDSLDMICKSFRGANTYKILNNIICIIYNVNFSS